MSESCPKVLVISANCFSQRGSNGKVLGEMFRDWKKENLAQFYVVSDERDYDTCSNYYQITDEEALKAVFSFKKPSGIKKYEKPQAGGALPTKKRVSKDPLKCLLRDIVWNSNRWRGKEFWSWVEEFNPDVILLQAGESTFLAKLTMKISEKLNVPFVIFNTENYYFKDFNYFFGKKFGFLYPLFHMVLKRTFKKLMRRSSKEIYTNSMLDRLYYNEFKKHGELIYQATSLKKFDEVNNDALKFMYAGNLGLNRHLSLIEIASSLQKLSKDFIIDIYGPAPNDDVKNSLDNAVGIRYHGRVSYDEVKEAIRKSDILIHTESFEEMRVIDLQTAFSTKIADCLASGRCLLLYADKSLACSKYLIENDCACVITKPSELDEKIKTLVYDKETRKYYIERALKIAEKNHRAEKNSELFRKIIIEVAEEK